MKSTVGFIGLGHAGKPMARNLVMAGVPLIVYDADPRVLQAGVALGATATAGPAEVAEASDVVFLSLPHPAISESVILGTPGVLDGARAGAIIVELSTISPSLARKIHSSADARGVSFLDAGVAGGIARAVTGELTIMVGGSREAFDRALPLLRVLGKHIFHVGPSGCGMATKVANNAISHVIMVAICEGASMAIRSGIQPEVFYEVVSHSSGNSTPFEERFKMRVLSGDFEPGMTVDLAYKDSQLALQLASELGVPLFVTQVAHGVYEWARARNLGGKDYAAIMTLWEDLLGFQAREVSAPPAERS